MKRLLSQARNLLWPFHRKLDGFHTFWTRPKPDIAMTDYELLTMIASALTYKKHNGRMFLYTDIRGFHWLQELGLLGLYDCVSTILDDVPNDIDPQVFWAAGKVFAYQAAPVPCVSIDLDAVIWERLPNYKADAVVLHFEPTNWGGYKNTGHLSEFGFSPEFGWDWSTAAANTGVAIFKDAGLKDCYTGEALRFMRTFSALGSPRPAYEGVMKCGEYTCVEEMIFAEQRLLMMCAAMLGKKVESMVGFDPAEEHIPRNSLVSHLWNSKRGYEQHGNARQAYCNYMIDYLLKTFPEIAPVLKLNNLLEAVVRDANVPAVRYGRRGEWTLAGEKVVA